MIPMTDPKVSQDDMVELLEIEIGLMRIYISTLPKDYSDEHRKRLEKRISIKEAIRAAIEERGRLRKKIHDWKKRLQTIFKERENSSSADYFLNTELFSVSRDIRDFKLDGEEGE